MEYNKEKKDKIDILNKSFKKKITEGSFRKVVKNKNNINNNINQEERKKKLIERAVNDNKLKNDKLSQTLYSGFYKNPFKNSELGINEIGGYKKKIIGNFKQDQEHKENNKNKQNVINAVFKKYNYFDNDNDNDNEEEKKKSNNDSIEGVENKIIENGKEENINKNVIESIKLLMSTLSFDGLKQIQNDIQQLLEKKNKN